MSVTIKEVRARLSRIREEAYTNEDNEVAHVLEDLLFREVLIEVADGCDNAKELAAEALKSSSFIFTRWYA